MYVASDNTEADTSIKFKVNHMFKISKEEKRGDALTNSGEVGVESQLLFQGLETFNSQS